MTASRSKAAFTLVELSIVLVIIGLLVGGVLSGQSLIRSAELRAIITERDKYITGVQTFRDKYFALPGDMTNATLFWGKNNTACAGNTGAAATPGTCNGNGDGHIDYIAMGEDFQFWNQLALAGLIEGNYTGVISGAAAIAGTNVPKSKVNNGAWHVRYTANFAGDVNSYAFDYQNYLSFGAPNGTNLPNGPILKPEEAWNIDTKLDDGKPGTGKIIAVYWNNACALATSVTDYAAGYNLSNASTQCAIYFTQAF